MLTYIISNRCLSVVFISTSKLISEFSNSQPSCLLTIRTMSLICLFIFRVSGVSGETLFPIESLSNNQLPKASGLFVSFMNFFRRSVTSNPSSFSVQLSHGPRWSFQPFRKDSLTFTKKKSEKKLSLKWLKTNKFKFKITLKHCSWGFFW